MTLVIFTRWCANSEGRTPVSVNNERVDCIEEYGPAFLAGTGESFPAASRIIMRNKQEYVVQGTVEEVTAALAPKS